MYKLFINRYYFITLLSLFVSFQSISQQQLTIDAAQNCSYFGENLTDDLYEFTASNEANQVIKQIMSVMGLKSRFEIKAANVPSAAAVIYNNKRYILYSQNFISSIDQNTHTDWGAISILAHEIGHHLNGHTLEQGGSRPSHELEADEFSGFVLKKMGASLAEAQAAMRILADEEGSYTHPPKSARLEAIAVGWKSAEETPTTVIAKNTPKHNSATTDQEARAQSPTADQATVSNSETPAGIDRKLLIGKVIFDTNPAKDYYLTTRLNLITVSPKGVEIVGKLTESNVSRYAYMIYNTDNKYVYVAKDSLIYNVDQEKVGRTVKL